MPNHRGEPTRHNGSAIRDYRIKLGLSPAELGRMVGLGNKAILNIETGTRDTRPEVLYRIAKALDVSIHSILRDEANGNGGAA